MKKILLTIALIISAPAYAETKYDYKTGNTITTTKIGDSTYVNGHNLNTGSSWNSHTNSSGNTSGIDSSGNSWNYNSKSGSYSNSDGRGCSGHGASRHCW